MIEKKTTKEKITMFLGSVAPGSIFQKKYINGKRKRIIAKKEAV